MPDFISKRWRIFVDSSGGKETEGDDDSVPDDYYEIDKTTGSRPTVVCITLL